jgi:large subunit ribosomal protein L28
MQYGHAVSHSNVKTKRKWAPNIQKVRALVRGRAVRVTVCSRCLRSGKIQRAL